MSTKTMDARQTRKHYENDGVLYELNKSGTVAHIRIGWNGSGGHCGKVGTGPYPEIPSGARVCKTCGRAHAKAHAETMRTERNNALRAGLDVQAGREHCQLCRVALPHNDASCSDTPGRGDWYAFRELVKEASTPREVWEVFRMFKDDDKESV